MDKIKKDKITFKIQIMAEGEEQTNLWPLPKFHFQLSIEGGIEASFQEVAGLDTEADPVEYQHGNSPEFSIIKMPGLMM